MRDPRFIANVVGVEYSTPDPLLNKQKMNARLIGALTPYQDYPEVREELTDLGFRPAVLVKPLGCRRREKI